MFGTIDLARPQIADQQLITTEYIQGKKAVMVIVAVKEPTHLTAMYSIIGCIEIKDQLFRGLGIRGDELVDQYMPPKAYADQWDMEGLYAAVIERLNMDLPVMAWGEEEGVDDDEIADRLEKAAEEMMADKAEKFGPENMRLIEKQILLQTIDQKWRDHLNELIMLRSGIGLRSFGQRNPLIEYKRESEVDPMRMRPHPYEFTLYYDI